MAIIFIFSTEAQNCKASSVTFCVIHGTKGRRRNLIPTTILSAPKSFKDTCPVLDFLWKKYNPIFYCYCIKLFAFWLNVISHLQVLMWFENTAHITVIYGCVAAGREMAMEFFTKIYQSPFASEKIHLRCPRNTYAWSLEGRQKEEQGSTFLLNLFQCRLTQNSQDTLHLRQQKKYSCTPAKNLLYIQME